MAKKCCKIKGLVFGGGFGYGTSEVYIMNLIGTALVAKKTDMGRKIFLEFAKDYHACNPSTIKHKWSELKKHVVDALRKKDIKVFP